VSAKFQNNNQRAETLKTLLENTTDVTCVLSPVVLTSAHQKVQMGSLKYTTNTHKMSVDRENSTNANTKTNRRLERLQNTNTVTCVPRHKHSTRMHVRMRCGQRKTHRTQSLNLKAAKPVTNTFQTHLNLHGKRSSNETQAR
jgi:hypothetical protein